MIKIYNKDSAEWLKKLPSNSVDSLVTDPPRTNQTAFAMSWISRVVMKKVPVASFFKQRRIINVSKN